MPMKGWNIKIWYIRYKNMKYKKWNIKDDI